MKKILPGFVAALLMLASLAFAAQSAHESLIELPPGSDAARRIAITTVARKPKTGTIDVTATIERNAMAVAQLTSPIPARVVRLTTHLGEQVRPGQSLAILSSVELGQAKADYLKAVSLERIAEQNLKREEDLFAKKITPMKDLLAARAACDTARAESRTARETLRLLIPPEELRNLAWSDSGRPLSEFPLTSPIAGTVVKLDLTIGAMVDRNHEPVTVVDLDQVWVMANVFEHDIAGLKLGAHAQITVETYPDLTFEGEVAYVGDQIDPGTRTLQARVVVPNPQHLLKPGMFARARIADGDGGQAIVVPESAIYESDGHKIAFVAEGQSSFAPRVVRIGSTGNGTVEILSGLKQGEHIVSSGGLALKTLLGKSDNN